MVITTFSVKRTDDASQNRLELRAGRRSFKLFGARAYWHGLILVVLIIVMNLQISEAQTFNQAINDQLAATISGELALGCARLVGNSPRDSVTLEPEDFGDELAEICGLYSTQSGTTPGSNASGGSGGAAVTQVVEERQRAIREDEEGGETEVDLGSGISFWISANYQELDRDRTKFEDGYDSDIWGATTGVDFMVNDSWAVGLAFNFHRWDGDFDSSGNFDTTTYGPSVYASLFAWENFFADAILSLLNRDVSNDRSRTYRNEVGEVFGGKVSANPDEYLVTAGFLMGYNIPIRQFTVGPRLALDYVYNDFDSYTEKGTTGLELKYDRDSRTSLQSRLGLQTSMSISTDFGVIVPQVSADWVHEWADKQRSISVQFVQDLRDNPAKFSFHNDKPDKNFFEINAGIGVVLPHNIQAFANYWTMAGHKYYDSQAGTIGFRGTF